MPIAPLAAKRYSGQISFKLGLCLEPRKGTVINMIEEYFKNKKIIPYSEFAPYNKIGDRRFWDNIKGGEFYTEAGEKYLNFEWKSVTATSFLKYVTDGIRLENEMQSFSKRIALGYLTLAECAENKGRFLNQIIDGIWSICEETTWAVCAHIGVNKGEYDGLPDTDFGITLDLFALQTAQLIGVCVYLMRERLDAVSKAIAKRAESEIIKRIAVPYLECDDYWWMGTKGNKVNNWNPWCVGNALRSCIAGVSDDDIRQKVFEKSIRLTDNYIRSVPDDGSCDEGSSYWFKAGGKLLFAVQLMCAATGDSGEILKNDKLRNISRFILNMHIDGKYYVNFADGSAAPYVDPMYIAYLADITGDRAFAEAASFVENGKAETTRIFDIAEELGAISAADKFEPSDTEKLEKSVYYPGIEVMTARQYAEHKKGFFLAAKGGNNGESHNHNDVGSYIVYFGGKPLIIDIGVETYKKDTFGENRYSIFTMKSDYHNLPIINSATQHNGEEYRAKNVRYESGIEKDVFALDISDAYEGAETSVERQFVFDRTDGITITDTYGKKSGICLVTMLAEKPIINGNTVSAGECEILFDCGSVSCEEIKITDKNLMSVWGGRIYRLKTEAVTDKMIMRIMSKK